MSMQSMTAGSGEGSAFLSAIKHNMREYGMLISLIVIMVFFQFQTEGRLFQPDNLTNIVQQRGYIDVRMDYEGNDLGEIALRVVDPLDGIPDPDATDYDPDHWHDWHEARWMTASQIEGRDYLAAKAAQRREAHAPSGPVVVVTGGKDWTQHEAIWQRLDTIRARIPAMVIATTAQRTGADAIAAAWAAARGVTTLAFRLERKHGNAAPFKRNQQLVALGPVEAIICEGSGIQANLAQRCREAGVPVTIYRHRDFAPAPGKEAG